VIIHGDGSRYSLTKARTAIIASSAASNPIIIVDSVGMRGASNAAAVAAFAGEGSAVADAAVTVLAIALRIAAGSM